MYCINYYYNFKAEYRFFKFIEMYVRTRIFDMRTFKEDMEVIINTIDTDKLPACKRKRACYTLYCPCAESLA